MRMAIAQARRNFRRQEGGPFGAVIVKAGVLVAAARNTVLCRDATCHAEINAIRRASARLGTYDLRGCVIYSTTEPCPMCFSAIHWARISAVWYGTTIADAAALGFHELAISNKRLKALGKSPVRVIPGFLREECKALFDQWRGMPQRKVY